VILAIYGDEPAAKKCSVTGSGCPVCFTEKREFAAPPAAGTTEKRTASNMQKRKRILLAMANSGIAGATGRANKRAKRLGVNLEVNVTFR
jgi:hypothetical protein